MKTVKIARLGERGRLDFSREGGPSYYDPLLADGDTPLYTGIQTARPGYVTPWHQHPYVEVLFVLEGAAEVEVRGDPVPTVLAAGDTVAIPPATVHRFATRGETDLRLLGIHLSPERIVQSEGGPRGGRPGQPG